MHDNVVWILLPSYNEAETLPRLLASIADAMLASRRKYHVVVVDDGSTDGTGAVLESLRRAYPVDVIRHTLNRGLGETERDGFEYIAERCAPDDVVVRLDCDDTHEPRYIETLVAKLDEGYDVVTSSRFSAGGGQVGVSRYRAIVSLAANIFMRLLFRVPGLREYSCGFRAYRGGALKAAIAVYGNQFLQLRGLGFTSTLETVVKLHLLGCRMTEVPFVLRYDKKIGASKMVGSVTTLGYFVMAILYHWPWGGWARQYAQLANLYRRDPGEAVRTYRRTAVRGGASQISF